MSRRRLRAQRRPSDRLFTMPAVIKASTAARSAGPSRTITGGEARSPHTLETAERLLGAGDRKVVPGGQG
jgi:hypothetical protein